MASAQAKAQDYLSVIDKEVCLLRRLGQCYTFNRALRADFVKCTALQIPRP